MNQGEKRRLTQLEQELSAQIDRTADALRDLEHGRKHMTAANERFDKLAAVDKLTRATLVLAIAFIHDSPVDVARSQSKDALLEAAYLATKIARP